MHFLVDPRLAKHPLSPARYTTSTEGTQGSLRLHLRRGRSVARGIQGNADEARGADVAS